MRSSVATVGRSSRGIAGEGKSDAGLVTTLNDKAPVELRELPEPQPQRNEALVAVHAFSLNRGELRSVRNNGEGWVPGQDVAGVVLKQAEDGSGPPAGARVVALTDEFGWAQRVAVPAHRMAVLPDNVSFAQAATLPVAGLTALRTLRHGAPLLGKRVLITGAAGGVGTLAVQLAARSGARVTAVVGRAERAAGLRELGALDVIEGIDTGAGSLRADPGIGRRRIAGARDQAGRGEGHRRGVRQFVGRADDARFADFRGAPNSRVQSFSYFYSEAEDRFAPDLALLVSLIADGSLKPQIGVERSWRDFAAVAEQLRDRRVAGKAVLLVEAG